MRVFTAQDMENFERDEYGRLICPSGDYTQIKSFGEGCSFGEYCSFGKCCSFGEYCNLDNNLKFENIQEQVDSVLKIDRIGSRKGCTYFFKTLSGIYVRCGCFFGTIAQFENAVNVTHSDNEQYRTEYLEAIKYIKKII